MAQVIFGLRFSLTANGPASPPGLPKAKVQARIIMTPQNAKSFSLALNENIGKFEEKYGEIKITGKEGERTFGFKTSIDGDG